MTLDDVRQEITDASHILAAHDILDAFGHVSRRSPDDPDRFFISRSLAPAMVTPADVLELDLDGRPVSDPSARVFLERFIHGEIYRRRPDVHGIVHSHALSVLPFTVVSAVPVRPICHMCGFLHGTPRPFDIADHAGPSSDMLISNGALGAALAEHLGDAAVVLMRGHGFTAVGASVPQATYRAMYAPSNCRIQREAMQLGEPVYLSEGEAQACEASIATQLDRAWNLWRRDVRQAGASGTG